MGTDGRFEGLCRELVAEAAVSGNGAPKSHVPRGSIPDSSLRMRLSVIYPLPSGRMVLRTEADWSQDLLPVEETPTVARFDLPFTGPTLAFKPCIRDGERVVWAKGANYVVSADEPDPHFHPYFNGAARGRISDVLLVQAEAGVHAVRVYHPPGYDENTLRRYPVLYMNDGQNLFFPEEAHQGAEWKVDETMDRLDEMNASRKVIVVGVAPADRMRDYTKPGYEAYGRFMVDRLKPLIDQHLRTLPGAADTVVMGSSLGGVAALFLAWNHPDVFGNAAMMALAGGSTSAMTTILAIAFLGVPTGAFVVGRVLGASPSVAALPVSVVLFAAMIPLGEMLLGLLDPWRADGIHAVKTGAAIPFAVLAIGLPWALGGAARRVPSGTPPQEHTPA